jgi:hypothetical protein
MKSPARLAGLELAGVGSSFQDQERESSDSPILKAFCRVAPSVRFKVRAMLAARVFFLASVFNVRTSSDFHARRLEFLAISLPFGWKNTPCFCSLMPLEWKHLNMAGSPNRPRDTDMTKQGVLGKFSQVMGTLCRVAEQLTQAASV